MKVAFIGGGNMASALIGGMLDAGFDRADIEVLELDSARARGLSERYRVSAHEQPGPWLSAADYIVVAVKPQQMRSALDAIKPHLKQALIVSIAAGVRATTIARWIESDQVVRAMPNTPALIKAGITGLIALPGVSAKQRSAAEKILTAVGQVIWFDDEAMLDAVTAVSGSGPAYVFFFLEAMQQAARGLGLDDLAARQLCVQTFIGAARLASESDVPIAELREQVTSKGGTTAAAVAILDRAEVQRAIINALHAARNRARELGDESDN